MSVKPLLILLTLTAPAMAQDRQVSAFAQQVLAQIQGPSFRADREYCGLIGIDAANRLVATPARKGRRSSCTPRDFDGDVEVIASYHSHGSYEDPGNEVPSPEDVLGDADEGIDGFVGTPGGRMWFVDGQREEVRQICGEACLPVDPAYDSRDAGPIAARYTLEGLEAFLNQ